MLKTPLAFANHPIVNMIAEINGNFAGVKILEEGVVEIGHFNLDMVVWGSNCPKMYIGYPDFKGLSCYGVCDSPKQFLTKYRNKLKRDKRTFVVGFTHVKKHPENAGNGGGWRWHKWGEYIGKGKPTMEYLDDEKEFNEGVYVYHILQLDGPALELDYQTIKLIPMKEKN